MPVRSYIQGFHCFLNRSFVVKTVNDIQIQIICSQPFQCTVNLSVNGFCRQIAKILLRIILCLRIPKLIVFAAFVSTNPLFHKVASRYFGISPVDRHKLNDLGCPVVSDILHHLQRWGRMSHFMTLFLLQKHTLQQMRSRFRPKYFSAEIFNRLF